MLGGAMRSGIVCIMLVTGLLFVSIPHADRAIAAASRLADGVDVIVVCGGADDRALGELGTALVIRSCWLSAVFQLGARALGTALKAASGCSSRF